MSQEKLIVAIDQGTTSSRAIVFNQQSQIVALEQQEFTQIYPEAGWVEHDPEQIWDTTLSVTQAAIQKAEAQGGRVEAIGITNQRETTIVWDRVTGRPIYNAIVWQDRRTSDRCKAMGESGLADEIQQRSGLLLDPYFSSTKIAWILDNVPDARERAEKGELAFGTVDCFLIWRLTGGKHHATDATNASRTNLFNIHTQQWDEQLLTLFDVPVSVLPDVRDCAAHYGTTKEELFGRTIPILGVAGDQQAAAIGQCCFNPGDIKSTYGTGCFVLINTGDQAIKSKHRLLTTVAYRLNGKPVYALEGSIFIAGAAVQWIRDGLGLISDAKETQSLASGLESNKGMYLVPAFTGLGAPYWEPDVRGAIFGLTRDSGPAEFARCALESVCYQTSDLFNAMQADGITPSVLRVDGGMSNNDWLMQFLANILNLKVDRPVVVETTALGVAYLAGSQVGVFDAMETIADQWCYETRFEPEGESFDRDTLLRGWKDAVTRLLPDYGK